MKTKMLSRGMSKKAMNKMKKELLDVLHTTDYSTYDIQVLYVEQTHTTIIPKPVMALSFVNEELRDWVIDQINQYPGCAVVIA